MNSWHGYPKVWNLGHPNVATIFDEGEVIVQEKYDGSQFSFCWTGEKMLMRSRRVVIDPELEVPDLFQPTVEHIMSLDPKVFIEGATYRGEAICRPRHNTLEYDRVPKGNFVLFDVETSLNTFISPLDFGIIASQLGIEHASVLTTLREGWQQVVGLEEFVSEALKSNSTLGGPIEGIVFKNYSKFTQFDHVMMAKYVSEQFKEKHQGNLNFKSGKNFVELLAMQYRSEARWRKSVERLRDEGKLENSPKDIGLLMKELNEDFNEECADEIKEKLWDRYRKNFNKEIAKGFAQWYKDRLAFRGEE